ncbi:ACP S-malonyltransferase [Hydrocarboniclastica marina]|uniref:Malonyl CoA-acyl carrier protein transacylase n=1 Tax=Hydrocarboniclastica marina TaxID=2259620 RepID=A0A4V1D8L4_9ALTE|nr:ACP S-malonyltransferase [Hydrocarboniclastica marina]MAL98655.1 [acyl-carrier-protein] S-malonyltransferase [Alteromonadaceae bacterium]QCF25600.1 [acyl-carrier-protein] S-malonyltransferase [Hydrocarboniclastica marina]|tara:strand:- start:13610 stop:14551 length:942 start_codon:yes stop_codon:yes gene_type:complete
MKTAFIFPGQGAQSVGMLAEARENFPIVRQTFDEASELLGYNLESICQNGPEEELNRTAVTQPAILTASIALWRLWMQENGTKPDFVAGHSLGEYSALVAGESMLFLDALKLVSLRGELMQAAVPQGEGKMAAILGLEDDQVVAACAEATEGDVVEAVNFNAPGQVVIAGNAKAVDRAIEACKSRGAKRAMPLAVSVPSHCALMREAAEQLAEEFSTVGFNDAVIPVVQNVPAAIVTSRTDIMQNLVRQLYSPVKWSASFALLEKEGVGAAVECGPGKVLGGLAKRNAPAIKCYSLETPDGFNAALSALSKKD